MQVVQHRMDNQPCPDRVQSYAPQLPAHPYRIKAWLTCLLLICNKTVNICTCYNGVAQTAAECPVNGILKCKSCNVGWTINHDSTKCISTFAHFCFHESLSKPEFRPCWFPCELLENTCTCINGVAESGARCPVDGVANCKSCNTGWTINLAGTECTRTLYALPCACIKG